MQRAASPVLYRLLPVCLLLLAGACATPPARDRAGDSVYLEAGDRLAACAQRFARTEEVIGAAGTFDAQSSPLDGFPYLRSNRFLADLGPEVDTRPEFVEWIKALRRLDRRARFFELQNALDRTPLPGRLDRLDSCAAQMIARDLADPQRLERLKKASVVEDSYLPARRVLGLYPLLRIPVERGVERLHERLRRAITTPPPGPGTSASLVSYSPMAGSFMTDAAVRDLIAAARTPALSIPVFSTEEAQRLFRHFAPVWEVVTRGDHDRPGAPGWSGNGTLVIAIRDSVVYRYLSYTRWQGEILPQFNYVIWFPSRPPASRFDLLAGHIDGITWRVTVGPDGRVLMYDSMHNCGCYHMFFPVKEAGLRIQPPAAGEEPLLVLPPVSRPRGKERTHIRLAPVSHYIEAVTNRAPGGGDRAYRFADYDRLRSLQTAAGGYESMFDGRGIVPGTSRGERWLLWPMGVEDPGAMRQRGAHATAFVGRRHFDDPRLLERYFTRPEEQGQGR